MLEIRKQHSPRRAGCPSRRPQEGIPSPFPGVRNVTLREKSGAGCPYNEKRRPRYFSCWGEASGSFMRRRLEQERKWWLPCALLPNDTITPEAPTALVGRRDGFLFGLAPPHQPVPGTHVCYPGVMIPVSRRYSVRTKSRYASLWPVVFQRVPVVLSYRRRLTNIGTRLVPWQNTCCFRGYALTRSLEGGIGPLLGSGDFPLGSPRPLQVLTPANPSNRCRQEHRS